MDYQDRISKEPYISVKSTLDKGPPMPASRRILDMVVAHVTFKVVAYVYTSLVSYDTSNMTNHCLSLKYM